MADSGCKFIAKYILIEINEAYRTIMQDFGKANLIITRNLFFIMTTY